VVCLIKLHEKKIDSGSLDHHCSYHKVTLSATINR
jgi:hypothetical protein